LQRESLAAAENFILGALWKSGVRKGAAIRKSLGTTGLKAQN